MTSTLILTALLLASTPSLQDTNDLGLLAGAQNAAAPAETTSYGRLVGLWRFTFEALDESGEVVATYEGEWNWAYVLGGHAIQDVFILPPRDQEAPPEGRFYGTALRIFDPATDRWQSAWLDTGGKVIERNEAVLENDDIVLLQDDGETRTRTTYHEITPSTFRWKVEVSSDGGASWRPTQRLLAKRVE